MSYSSKCFSSCRKVPKTRCNKPRCSYVDGKQHQYCRLSRKYVMERTKDGHCITKKSQTTLDQKQDAKEKIGRFMIQSHEKRKEFEKRERIITKLRESMYGRRIHHFIKRTTQKRRAEFLKAICSDSGVCIAFGQEENKIRDFFNGFTRFDHIESPIMRIGQVSANGFVQEIKYSHLGYNAYAILKSSAKPKADNLLYEYMVGQYINKLSTTVPCFLETYGIYGYVNNPVWHRAKQNHELSAKKFVKSLVLLNANELSTLQFSCTNSEHLAILIQHIKDAKTIGQMLENQAKSTDFVKNHLLYVLYQVYRALAQFSESFTHYDLHRDNVLLYKPVDNKYIQYHYHLPNGTVTKFKSFYIAKIIDYGRCFYNDIDEKLDSVLVHNVICSVNECNPDCGNEVGYGFLQKEDYPGSNYHISSLKRNVSHDLRLLNNIYVHHPAELAINGPLHDIVSNVNYDDYYGTKEIKKNGLPNHTINNVKDAHTALRVVVENQAISAANEAFYADPAYSKLGDLHIYGDGSPMKFEKA